MSRGGMDRESFVKGQLEAVHKALTKHEMPLKPKHARRLIVGTHQEGSSSVFWNTVNRIQLEKNPILTWKFCHLLHKLIRDGHRKVPEESHRFIPRINQLGQFWKHLNTSGYGICNEIYAKLLVDRLDFHRKFPVVPGSLVLSENQIKTIESDLDNTFEMTVSMLDEMDNLLNLQSKVYDTMDCLRWSSLVPQGQCLLAPLIIVILDTSKFYDYLVKMIFKLHSAIPPDALEGHRTRFREVFRRTKKFYEESSNLQYFKYLVSIPTLPSIAPNFLQASDLDSYEPPRAYLHSEGPDDSVSVAEEALLDISTSENREIEQLQETPSVLRDEQLLSLQRSLEDERFAKERLITEVRSRIEQYENRLAQMQGEFEHAKRESDEMKEENDRLHADIARRDASREESDDARVREATDKARIAEERFAKLKGAYDKFRSEHVLALTNLGKLQRDIESLEKIKMDKEEECTAISRKLEEAEREKSSLFSKSTVNLSTVDELRTQLAKADIEMEELRRQVDHERTLSKSALVRATDNFADEKLSLEVKFNDDIRWSVLAMFDKAEEELQNATSISYPPHLIQSEITALVSSFQLGDVRGIVSNIHFLTMLVPSCASGAYTASIQHFESVHDQCKKVLSVGKSVISSNNLNDGAVLAEIRLLESLVASLPLQTDVDKDVVGAELETEMKRMDNAIKHAVAQIEAIQRKARENSSGLKLEVHESILSSCQTLMNAIMRLVIASRELQAEIVVAGRAGVSPAEFYKRNHQWTEGLLSAAKAVGVAATVLTASADGVVTGQGKLEQLIVAAQEIAASTAQLFVSSRVKADRDSQKLAELSVCSKEVNQCTAQVVATVKSGQTTLSGQDILDFSHLSLHDAKKEEMESQVRTLELEQALNVERARLRELRKQHYHMAQLVANKDSSQDFELIG